MVDDFYQDYPKEVTIDYINYMSGGRNDDVVQVFLDEKNRNGAEEFAVVFMGAMMSWGTNKNFTSMSFPMNMYAAVGSPDLMVVLPALPSRQVMHYSRQQILRMHIRLLIQSLQKSIGKHLWVLRTLCRQNSIVIRASPEELTLHECGL